MAPQESLNQEVPKGRDPSKQYEKQYHDVLDMVRHDYYLPDKANALAGWEHRFDRKLTSEDARDNAISQMVDSLHDPWTQYTSAKMIAEHQKLFTDGNRRSAGIWVKSGDDGTPEISCVLHGFAAFNSPLRAGDKLVSLNGQPLAGKRPDEIENMLQGQIGQSLKIEYRTPGSTEVKTVDVPIDKVYSQDASAKIMQAPDGKKFLYAYLPSFDKDAISAFDDAVDAALKSNGGQNVPIILDLRGNSGGFINSARYFESEFLKGGVAYKELVRDGNKQVAVDRPVMQNIAESDSDRARLNELQNMPLVVMMDDSSRSAAETTIAGLQDNHRTTAVVGTHSFGKAIVYDNHDLPFGGGLSISSSIIESPTGRQWQGKGLLPDVQVDRPREGSITDVQLNQAIATLESSISK
jgi:carboxyl-terminal processing protease